MNKKSFAIIFAGIFLFLGAAVSANAQSVGLSGSIGKGTVTRGSTARATVVMSIPGGLHANSHRPGAEYQIPTTVSVTVTGARAGAVSYPAGRNRKFSFSDSAINVYEGRVTFGFNVTVPASFKGSTLKLRATVHYQACTNEVCYPPTSKTVNLTARVN
jgi:DsbC/DsbD-like thiol-disulfide interchange protein